MKYSPKQKNKFLLHFFISSDYQKKVVIFERQIALVIAKVINIFIFGFGNAREIIKIKSPVNELHPGNFCFFIRV